MIRKGGKKVIAYRGDHFPVSVHKGADEVLGIEEKSSTSGNFTSDYALKSVLLNGKTEQGSNQLDLAETEAVFLSRTTASGIGIKESGDERLLGVYGNSVIADGSILGAKPSALKETSADGTQSSTTSLPVSTYFPNGMHAIGDVRDEIDFEKGVAVQRIGRVDLGTLGLSNTASTLMKISDTSSLNAKFTLSDGVISNVSLSKNYNLLSSSPITGTDTSNEFAISANNVIYINDVDVANNIDSFKALHVIMLYELATPITTRISSLDLSSFRAFNGGHEEFVGTDVPCGLRAQYSVLDIADRTKRVTTPTPLYEEAISFASDFGEVTDLSLRKGDFAVASNVATEIEGHAIPKGTAWICRKTGAVDMGSLYWRYTSFNGNYLFFAIISKMKSGKRQTNGRCDNYALNTRYASYEQRDNTITLGYDNNSIYVKDSRFSSASDFKTAVTGTMLYYELATPTWTQVTDGQLLASLGYKEGARAFKGDREIRYWKAK